MNIRDLPKEEQQRLFDDARERGDAETYAKLHVEFCGRESALQNLKMSALIERLDPAHVQEYFPTRPGFLNDAVQFVKNMKTPEPTYLGARTQPIRKKQRSIDEARAIGDEAYRFVTEQGSSEAAVKFIEEQIDLYDSIRAVILLVQGKFRGRGEA
jgi:hypothetical protein